MSHETLLLMRTRFVEIDIERMAGIRSSITAVLAEVPGFISTGAFERHDDPFAFMAMGHFSSEEGAFQGWDLLQRSPVMDTLIDIFSEAPNTARFRVLNKSGLSVDDLAPGQFCSLSTRIADLGFGPDLATELEGIFDELGMIPGFLGHVTGQLVDVPEEILGLAFWKTKPAFDASLPEKPMYSIDLYFKVL